MGADGESSQLIETLSGGTINSTAEVALSAETLANIEAIKNISGTIAIDTTAAEASMS